MLFWRNRHEVDDEELNAFVDGELEESGRRRVERHLESCARCSEAGAELRARSRALDELPSVRAPRSFAQRGAGGQAGGGAACTKQCCALGVLFAWFDSRIGRPPGGRRVRTAKEIGDYGTLSPGHDPANHGRFYGRDGVMVLPGVRSDR